MAVIARRGHTWNRQPSPYHVSGTVCKFWLSGNCKRNPCRFLHPEISTPKNCTVKLNSLKSEQSSHPLLPAKVVTKRPNEEQNAQNVGKTKRPACTNVDPEKAPGTVCTNVDPEKRANEEQNCRDVKNVSKTKKPTSEAETTPAHSWSSSDDFSKMVQLNGHQKAVTGINLPKDSDKLFSSSEDGTVRVWNCNTGECIVAAQLGAPVRCLASEGPWVLAGLTNAIKAWNIETNVEITLTAPGGHVCSLTLVDGVLYAGLQDGSILVWKLNSETGSFEEYKLAKGHTGSVVSLFRGGDWLFSGSTDKTVRVWDYENMVCVHTLEKHTEEVTSVLCWELYLFSCSSDKTVKVWSSTEAGALEVVHTHIEEIGIRSLQGMYDAAGNPILLCSCNDNSVRLYDLPSFKERGRIYAKGQVRTVHVGPKGLFFTGDEMGAVLVWRCSGDFSGSQDLN